MDKRATEKLELDKILRQLSGYAAFSASKTLLDHLQPTGELNEARRRLQETNEARRLLEEHSTVSVGGAHDVRPHVDRAERGIALAADQLLDIKSTLQSAGRLRKTIGKLGDDYPLLVEMSLGLDEGRPIVDAVTRIVSDQGQILDSASPKLAQIRRDLQVAHSRLQSKLQAIVGSSENAPYLQESLITQRGGRYVIPIKADAKGRIKGIVHDQSSSGATLFIEPIATVEINNEIRELELGEQNEIMRILHEISAQVADYADPIRWTVESLADLDVAFTKAKFAGVMNADAPTLVDFDPERYPGSTLRLYNARHPLIDPGKVVPIDVVLSEDTSMLVITGPNTGGKTVSLKTVGLLTLMAQCGLHIPAASESVLTVFDAVYADIGDEQSIEQSLSTFSAHLTHIVDILEVVDERSLVLLDELGAGTDPAEGAALARSILNDLLQRGVTTFVATHYPELKLYAHSTPGVSNASVEFDVETLSPTYRLIIGLPGRSNAFAIATRLGLPGFIIDEARGYVGADDLHADDLLDEIHQTREEIRQTRSRLEAAEKETLVLRDDLRERIARINEERRVIIDEARQSADEEIAAIRDELGVLRRQLRTIPPTFKEQTDATVEELRAVEAEIAAVEELIAAPVEPVIEHEPAIERQPVIEPETPVEVEEPFDGLKIGDNVFVPSLNSVGEIVSLGDGSEAEVQVGQFRVRADPADLEFRSRRSIKKAGRESSYESAYADVSRPSPESPGLELHLRGYTLDEALPVLEEYLDQAYLSGLPWVRIIHGKGSGVIRRMVHQTLRNSPLVKEFKNAPANQGGDGATIVHFVPLV
ncbi:MAG: endonuclease MutS2 [Anaerolineae bacterium]|nr:endonuclease MutS2 [Anaerolineae bacterium]